MSFSIRPCRCFPEPCSVTFLLVHFKRWKLNTGLDACKGRPFGLCCEGIWTSGEKPG
jgi:hypothetical protein